MRIDLTRLPGPHKHIALVPQWDFLEMLASAAAAEPTFRLMRSTEVLEPGRGTGGRVTGRALPRRRRRDRRDARRPGGGLRRPGVDASHGGGADAAELRRARWTCGGSGLPRHDGDPRGLNGVFQSGHGCALIDRGDYFQIAYLIRKGADTAMRAEGIESLRRQVDRTGAVARRPGGHVDILRRRQTP